MDDSRCIMLVYNIMLDYIFRIIIYLFINHNNLKKAILYFYYIILLPFNSTQFYQIVKTLKNINIIQSDEHIKSKCIK